MAGQADSQVGDAENADVETANCFAGLPSEGCGIDLLGISEEIVLSSPEPKYKFIQTKGGLPKNMSHGSGHVP